MWQRKPPLWLLVLLWWTAYAVLFAGQVLSMNAAAGRVESWSKVLNDSLGIWLTWVPLTLLLIWVARRYPLQRGKFARALAIQTLAVLVVVLLRGAHMYFTNSIYTWYDKLPGFGEVALTSLRNNIMMAWMVVAAAHALVLSERMRERERALLQVEAHLARTRLEALTAKLNPHFLFNTLNSIAELVQSDPDVAEDMLVGLSELLHDSLDADQAQERPLREEIELIRTYLRIESLRLGERMQLQWSIEERSLSVHVPVLILLPLIENAIVHAIAKRRQPSRLSVLTRVDGARLLIEVENTLPGEGARAAGGGLGLSSTRERLRWLYGDAASLEHGDTEHGEHRVRITLPASAKRIAPDAATPASVSTSAIQPASTHAELPR